MTPIHEQNSTQHNVNNTFQSIECLPGTYRSSVIYPVKITHEFSQRNNIIDELSGEDIESLKKAQNIAYGILINAPISVYNKTWREYTFFGFLPLEECLNENNLSKEERENLFLQATINEDFVIFLKKKNVIEKIVLLSNHALFQHPQPFEIGIARFDKSGDRHLREMSNGRQSIFFPNAFDFEKLDSATLNPIGQQPYDDHLRKINYLINSHKTEIPNPYEKLEKEQVKIRQAMLKLEELKSSYNEKELRKYEEELPPTDYSNTSYESTEIYPINNKDSADLIKQTSKSPKNLWRSLSNKTGKLFQINKSKQD